MTELGYTPGPWEAKPYGKCEFEIDGDGNFGLALVYSSDGLDEPSVFPAAANARLIAAAPELYETLKALLSFVERRVRPLPHISEQEGVMLESVRTALAKVEGQNK